MVDRNDDDADDDEEEGKFVQEWKASVFNLSSCGQSNITSFPERVMITRHDQGGMYECRGNIVLNFASELL